MADESTRERKRMNKTASIIWMKDFDFLKNGDI